MKIQLIFSDFIINWDYTPTFKNKIIMILHLIFYRKNLFRFEFNDCLLERIYKGIPVERKLNKTYPTGK